VKYLSAGFFLVILIFSACYQGHGLDPIAGSEDAAGIRGRIIYEGSWPDSTREVRVAVMKTFPTGISDNDSLVAFMMNAFNTGQLFFSDTLSKYSETGNFEIQVSPGEYAWVLAVWFPDIPLYLMGVKQLGAYVVGGDQFFSPVRVMPGSFTENINITANLDRARGTEVFIKPGERR